MKKLTIVIGVLSLTGCLAEPVISPIENPIDLPGQILKSLATPSLTGGSLTMKASIPRPKIQQIQPTKNGGFNVSIVEPTDVYFGNALVTGNGIGAPIAPNAPTNPFALPNGTTTGAVTFPVIPTGNNRVVTVTGLNEGQTSIAPSYEIKGVVNINPGANTVAISYATTPTARVIEKLIADAHATANTVDFTTIQTVVDRLVDNNTGGAGDDIHPTLVNHDAIAAFIEANGTAPPAIPVDRGTYAFTAGTVSGTLTGIQEAYKLGAANETVFPPLTITSNDPASAIVTVAAQTQAGTPTTLNYSVPNVTPGNGHTVTIRSPYHVEKSAVFNVTAGGTADKDFTYAAGDKRHWLQEAISPGLQINRYQNGQTLDVLIIKPNNPAATAVGWTTADHLDATTFAVDQIKKLFKPQVVIGQVDQVFDNDANFGVTPLPAIGNPIPSSTADVNSPNHVTNHNINLVGKYDLYIRWRTNFCPSGSQVGVMRSSFGPTTYTTVVELATQTCAAAPITYESARAIAAHEVIHALGVGHSSTNTDIMFSAVNFTQPLNLNPSARDINTIKLLYDANATNTSTDHNP